MTRLLLLGIRLYWKLWPERFRRSCLFRESCSKYVYRVTAHTGASAGFAALLERARRCRGGYSVETLAGEPYWSAAQQRQQAIAQSCSE